MRAKPAIRAILGPLCCAALLAAAPASSAATPTLLGSTLAGTDSNNSGSCGSPCTQFNVELPGATLAAPADGTITTWRVRSSEAFQYGLRILRPVGDGKAVTPVSTSYGNAVGANAITSFPVAIPVQAGDRIALRYPTGLEDVVVRSGGTPGGIGGCIGGTSMLNPPEVADGATVTPNYFCSTSAEYLFNADFVAAPVLDSISPASGPAAGGNAVVVTGSNLEGVSSVTFGGTPATFSQGSAKQFTATAPPGPAGQVDVRVTTGGGTSPAVAAGRYTYVAAATTGPLETTIVKAKIKGAKAKATFHFSGSGGTAALTYKCKLDKRSFAPCTSPKTYRKLKPGPHTFKVEAVDGAGQVDATPASKRFRVPD